MIYTAGKKDLSGVLEPPQAPPPGTIDQYKLEKTGTEAASLPSQQEVLSLSDS